MDNNQSGYIWHLIALLLLWGLAGKLDEPPEGWPSEEAEVVAIERPAPPLQPAQLLCRVESFDPAGQRRRRPTNLGPDLVSFQPHPPTTGEFQSRVVHLECTVVSE